MTYRKEVDDNMYNFYFTNGQTIANLDTSRLSQC